MTTLYVQSPTLYQASSGNIVGATSITLTSFTDIYGNVLTMADFGAVGYGTAEPDTTNSEGFTFTGVTANANSTYTLTGVKTILAKSPYTQTSGLIRQHSGGTKIVITDNVGFWDTFVNKNNDSTILGKITLTSTQKMIYDANPTITDDKEVATKKYVDDVAIAGAPDASTTVKGISEEATQAEVLTKTTIGGTGARLFVNPSTLASTLLSDYKADTGSANAYVITPAPAITAYTVGQIFSFKATNANTTTSTLNVSGLGAKTINKLGGSTALASGDIAAGMLVVVEYDGTNFVMLNPVANSPTLYTNFGDGSDGDATIASGTTTLTTDKFYNNLTIQTGGILNPAGFRVFVKGTLTFEGTGKIASNGGNGGAGAAGGLGGTNASGGTAGAAAITAGSLPSTLPGFVGGTGATAATGVAGSNGTNGTSNAKSLGVSGVAGAAGASGGTAAAGSGPGTAGTAGTAGVGTGTVFNKLNSILSTYLLIDNQPTITTLTGSNGSGGGGGGGGGKSTNGADCGAGGGGGGSGAPGGIVWVSANTVVTASAVYLQAIGGNGGNGGAGGSSTGNNGGGGGGGGAGSGGSGGVIIFIYHSLSGSGTTSVAGGTAGTGGAAGAANGTGTTGGVGSNGTAGLSGVVYTLAI